MPRTKLPQGEVAMRAALVRRAMDLVGAGAFARMMGVAERTARAWAIEGGDATRPVSDAIIARTIEVLIGHRQHIGALVSGLRLTLAGRLPAEPLAPPVAPR